MKKRSLKNLSLNKKSISSLTIKGGLPEYTFLCKKEKEPATFEIDCMGYGHEPYTSRDMNGALPSECESVPL